MYSLFNDDPERKGAAEGEARRDAAHVILIVHRRTLILFQMRAFLRHLLANGPASSDAMRALVPIPKGVDPRCTGAAVRALASLKLITSVGRTRTRRAPGHARGLELWAITDEFLAHCWLAANPAPTEPAPTAGEVRA